MRPPRETFRQSHQTYFVTFQTSERKPFFRNQRWHHLMVGTLASYQPQVHLHDFVIMQDHLHLILTPDLAIERAVQLIKGGYSYQARRAFGWRGDIWQRGFSDHRIRDASDLQTHLLYLHKNARTLPDEGRVWNEQALVQVSLDPIPQWLKPLD